MICLFISGDNSEKYVVEPRFKRRLPLETDYMDYIVRKVCQGKPSQIAGSKTL